MIWAKISSSISRYKGGKHIVDGNLNSSPTLIGFFFYVEDCGKDNKMLFLCVLNEINQFKSSDYSLTNLIKILIWDCCNYLKGDQV
jgi:hypothetical protein